MKTSREGAASGVRVTFEAGLTLTELSPKQGLTSVLVDQRVGMVGVAELTFVGLEGQWPSFALGTGVAVHTLGGGPHGALLQGTITGLRHRYQRGEQRITVIVSDALHPLSVRRSTQAFGDPDQNLRHTDSEIAGRVITQHGLTPRVDQAGYARAYVVQRNETDLSFLHRLARRNGWVITAAGPRTVVVGRRPEAAEVHIDRACLISLDYTWSPNVAPEQLTVTAWDYLKKEPVEGTVQGPAGGGPATWLGDAVADQPSAARALAQSELERLGHALVRGQARVVGDGAVKPHQMVRFAGHPEGFNPVGYVVAARHRLIDGQYLTDFRFTSDKPPGAPDGE